jgi:peptide/nickel transport system substrate-binding protein
LVPISGGVYSEAAVGNVKMLNPILPDNTTSDDINRLIFSGLTQFNAQRQVVSDLATSWSVSPNGRTYTFHLRKGVTWQDGVPFTADDVLFTLAAIQNPDTRSPLAPSWQGVKATAPDQSTVVFALPGPLASFIDSTTVGILPRRCVRLPLIKTPLEPARFRSSLLLRAPTR